MTQTNTNNLVAQGRIVWSTGGLFEGRAKTDYNTGQPVYGADGQPSKEFGFGLAIPKIDPATGQLTAMYQQVWQALHNEALTLYPNGQIPPGFAMKFKDGDSVDHNGKNYADREGYAGHIVLACTTQLPIKFFRFEGGNNIMVNDGVKVGDYVNVQLNIKAHPAKGQGKAGLYLNPSAVQLVQPGKEIINTPSGDQIFGNAAPAPYNGQVEAPVNTPMPGMTPQGMPGQMQPQQQAPAMNPAMPPQQQVPAQANPHYGVLPGQMQPQQQVHAPAMNQAMPQQQVHAPAINPAMPPQQQASMPGMPPMPGMPS